MYIGFINISEITLNSRNGLLELVVFIELINKSTHSLTLSLSVTLSLSLPLSRPVCPWNNGVRKETNKRLNK